MRKGRVNQIIHHSFVDKYLTLNKTLSFKLCSEQQIDLERFVLSVSEFLTARVVR